MKSILTLLTAGVSALLIGGTLAFAAPGEAAPMHGAALYGSPKYPAGFAAFDYVRADAPKGGVLRQAAYASFDTFNPFVINGVAAPGIGLIYDTLMKQSLDEPFSLYGLIAETIDIAPDRSSVTFRLNPAARFSDGTKITSSDVVFSFEMLRDKGLPMYRAYYRDVTAVTAPDAETVVFTLSKETNRELPLILGELPILSKAWWAGRDFGQTTMEVPVGSGPYRIKAFKPGRFIAYERNPDYWATDLNVNKGAYNFDVVQFDIYRDTTVAVEAFKAGLIDVRMENEAKKWEALVKTDLVRSGRVRMGIFMHRMPAGMQGFVFNLRRPVFQDSRVRRALAYAFDFEWTNQNLFFNAYQRTESYFENSFLKAPPLPTAAELALLEPIRETIPASVFTEAYKAPDHTGNIRWNLGQALDLLKEAGWQVRRGILMNNKGEAFRFEILLDSSSAATWERVILPFIDRLKRIGIDARIRTVDPIQYKNRLDAFDYDMIVGVWGQSFSPGNEQRYFWGSAAADTPGSWNFSGIQNKGVDALIEAVVRANTQADHETAVHALDRVLLHLHLVIPHWYAPAHRYLFWDKFGVPGRVPIKGADPMLWWDKGSEKAAVLPNGEA